MNNKDIGLAGKITLTILFAASFTAVITALLIYFNIDRSYSELSRDHYQVLASEIKKKVDTSLRLGLSIDEIEQAQSLLVETSRTRPDISVLRVVDTSGQVLYSLNQADIGKVPNTSDAESEFIRLTLRNEFNVSVGELVLAYSKSPKQQAMSETFSYLLKSVAVILLAVALVVAIGAKFITRVLSRRLTSMESSLNGLLSDSSHDPVEVTNEGELEAYYHAFHEKSQELLFSFDAAEKSLDGIDIKERD